MNTTDNLDLRTKKLSSLRKILWICFAGIAIPLSLLLVPLWVLIANLDQMGISGPPGVSDGLFLFMSFGFLLTVIGLVGVICAVIYHIFKYRLEKDDELFL
jgi:heme/copper-type cytochrome/quinol oxidase subunit 2